MKYSQLDPNTPNTTIYGAGMLMTDFNTSTWAVDLTKCVGATNGGIAFKDEISFKDMADGIDNAPGNMLEFKVMNNSDRKITVSGTLRTVNKNMAKMLMAAADIANNTVTPRTNLTTTDFTGKLWIVMPYGKISTGDYAGGIAIEIKNILHTGGFQIQTQDEDYANISFEFTAHFSIDNQDEVPYKVHFRDSGSTIPSIALNTHYAEVVAGSTVTLTATTIPASATVAWSSGTTAKATVSGGVVTGVAAGSSIITASITQDGVTYDDTCTVVVTAAS